MNEDTRKRVQEVIQELNYKPNAVARSLFKKESKTIGFIVPDITNPFFPALVRSVEDYINQKGFTIILSNSDENPEKEKHYLDIMKQKYVDGVIMVTNTLDHEQISTYSMPIVLLDRPIHADVPSVFVDNRLGGRLATEHLLKQGCQRIAHIKGPEKVINADDRYQGYLDVVGKLPWFSKQYIVSGNYDKNTAMEVTKKLLQNHPEIDGIFAGNDMMALGVLKAAEQLGIKVPEQLAIIGFDDIDLTEMTSPELSSVAQPVYEVGKKAAEMLIHLIEGKNLEKKQYIFDVELIERKSSKRL